MPKPADWDKIKTRWESGEDLAGLSRATGRAKGVIEAEAKHRKWRNDRRPTIAPAHARSEAKSARVVLTAGLPTLFDQVDVEVSPGDLADRLTAQTANANHLHDHERLRLVGLALLEIAAQTADARLLTSVSTALKTAQDGQRKSLGISDKSGDGQPDGEGLGAIVIPVKTIEAGDDAINEAIGITPIIPSDG